MRRLWHPVAEVDDVQEGPVGVTLLGEKIVLAHLDGEIVALQDLCRHFGAALSLGWTTEVDGAECIQCPYHGWTYDSSGQCVHIPQLAEGRGIPRDAQVPAYRVTTAHDLIWVCLENEALFGIPDFPELTDDEFRAGPVRGYDPDRGGVYGIWKTSAPRLIAGTLDMTHFPWVHEGILGERDDPIPPEYEVWFEDDYLMCRYTVDQPETDVGWGETTYTNYVTPNSIRLVKTEPNGKTLIIWFAVHPVDDDETIRYSRVARNYDLTAKADREQEEFQDVIEGQDLPIVESQRPELLPPLSERLTLPLRPADEPLIAYQRWLEELGMLSETGEFTV